ncbi:DUF6370 family protein [Hymenobacter canadensis]|uniref:DUF6370 family protein n=1 Tax=Hymenobacter canadensis TaxID=2999067 RepID=A0ABY7LW85_9BACT|nr:DUF6370 family protein [Hymenobacter canadensis]WBA43687.1 DUF6370 family protein [Hymenobacter canadensis]
MKNVLPLLLSLLLLLATSPELRAQSVSGPTSSMAAPNPAVPVLQVDASCGQCRFGLKGKDCDLAIRMDGKAYFVDGTTIDSHGDAHADNGFCNTVRKAEVQGSVVDNRFKATYFRLLPEPTKSK